MKLRVVFPRAVSRGAPDEQQQSDVGRGPRDLVFESESPVGSTVKRMMDPIWMKQTSG